MDYRILIKKSWEITNNEKNKLFPFAFIPSFFNTIVGVIFIAYQILALKDSPIFSTPEKNNFSIQLLTEIFDFLGNHPTWGALIIITSFFILMMYFLSPNVFNGALIHLIAKKVYKKDMIGGLERGFECFFPIFEFATMTSVFSFSALITEILFIIRNFEVDSWPFLITCISIIFSFGIFLSLLFIFTEQFIVLENKNVISSIKASSLMVLSNVRDIIFLLSALVLIGVRIILNILLILLIPVLMFFIITVMASLTLKWLGVLFASFLGLSLLVVGAYLMAGFHIFTYSLWTTSYLYFKTISAKKDE
jgi:hypothetical protein